MKSPQIVAKGTMEQINDEEGTTFLMVLQSPVGTFIELLLSL